MVRHAMLIPLKSFDVGKSRLRADPAVDVDALVRALASGVIAAGAPLPVYVVTSDLDVATFARDRAARPLLTDVSGLNQSLTWAVGVLRDEFDYVTIAHGDLRTPEGLGHSAPRPGVTIVTDHHRRGTNVLGLWTREPFTLHFGPDSALAHINEARARRLAHLVISDSAWRFDVDEVQDLQQH